MQDGISRHQAENVCYFTESRGALQFNACLSQIYCMLLVSKQSETLIGHQGQQGYSARGAPLHLC